MRKLWQTIGTIAFWLSWPALGPYLRHSKRTRVLITCGDYLVVTKSWLGDGRWSLPGGGLHKDEPPAEGAQREVREETGLELAVSDLHEQGNKRFESHGLGFSYVFFTAAVREQLKLRPQPFEITETRWLLRNELTSANAAPDVMTALADWPI